MIDLNKGFTLFELLAVLLILGILAAFAAPNLNLDVYRQQGFIQQSLAALRYAQKQAIGSGCYVQVNINAVNCNLTWTGAPAGSACPVIPLLNPATGNVEFCEDDDTDVPAGSVFPAAFVFDNIGRPNAGTVQYVFGARTIQIEAETGYVREL